MLRIVGITLALLVLAVAAMAAYGNARWARATRTLVERLDGARAKSGTRQFAAADLATLPAPVQRYLRAVLREGQPYVVAANFAHTGTFNSDAEGERWRPFRSTQHVVIDPPGFVWDGGIALLPGVPVRVHDAYVGREGVLHAAVFGLFSVANERGTGELARGELMRFFAETAWYPTVLLPGGPVTWTPVDAHSARGVLQADGLRIELTFTFGADGLIERVVADARGRMSGGRVEMLPWEGRFWNYAERDGMKVPLEGEVAWITPAGAKPYWRGRLETIVYEF